MGHGWPDGYHERQSLAQKKRFETEIPYNRGKYKNGKIGYFSLHRWVYSKLGSPRKCDHCGTTNASKYQWANRTGKYLQELDDWIRLCPRCHIHYDGTFKNLLGSKKGRVPWNKGLTRADPRVDKYIRSGVLTKRSQHYKVADEELF